MSRPVSRIVAILLLVAGLAAAISRVEQVHGRRSAGLGVNVGEAGWVRTADGWEPREALSVPTPAQPARLLPWVVAAFLGLLSAFFLVAFSSDGPSATERK